MTTPARRFDLDSVVSVRVYLQTVEYELVEDSTDPDRGGGTHWAVKDARRRAVRSLAEVSGLPSLRATACEVCSTVAKQGAMCCPFYDNSFVETREVRNCVFAAALVRKAPRRG